MNMNTAWLNRLLLLPFVLNRCRFGEVEEAVGVVGHPLASSRCETLAQVILRFSSGHTAGLYSHFSRIPMKKLPFFQIFGDKVGEHTTSKMLFLQLMIYSQLNSLLCCCIHTQGLDCQAHVETTNVETTNLKFILVVLSFFLGGNNY